jgi:hypothetical protein
VGRSWAKCPEHRSQAENAPDDEGFEGTKDETDPGRLDMTPLQQGNRATSGGLIQALKFSEDMIRHPTIVVLSMVRMWAL